MYKDPFTGLYHTHYRDYDPIHNRWLSEDPAGYMDGLNLYVAYMGMDGRDPLGLNVIDDELLKDPAYIELLLEIQGHSDARAQRAASIRSSFYGTSSGFLEKMYSASAAFDLAEANVNRYNSNVSGPLGKMAKMRDLAEYDHLTNSGLSVTQVTLIKSGVADVIVNADKAATGVTVYGENLSTSQRFESAFLAALETLPAAELASVGTRSVRHLTKLARGNARAKALLTKIGQSQSIPTLARRHAQNFQGGIAERIVLDQAITVYRVHGGGAGKVGSWLSGDIIKSKLILRKRLALKQEWGNSITKLTEVTIPKGTAIWRGKAAGQLQKNGKYLKGGGDQIFIDVVDPSWFKNTRHLK
jgi:hypothetical protein